MLDACELIVPRILPAGDIANGIYVLRAYGAAVFVADDAIVDLETRGRQPLDIGDRTDADDDDVGVHGAAVGQEQLEFSTVSGEILNADAEKCSHAVALMQAHEPLADFAAEHALHGYRAEDRRW